MKFRLVSITKTLKQGGGGAMVRGAFLSSEVKALIRCDKSVNAAEYLKFLRKKFIASAPSALEKNPGLFKDFFSIFQD